MQNLFETERRSTGTLFNPNESPESVEDIAALANETSDPTIVQKKLIGAIEKYKAENPQLTEANKRLKQKMERVGGDCELIAENHRLLRMLKSLEVTNRDLKSKNAQMSEDIQKMERQGQKILESFKLC